jgi:predicted kinase
MIHFVCGSTGAGKSTYAARLAERIGGVTFYLDEWMTALFGKDAPQPLDAGWMMERVGRCQLRIWETARQVAAQGTPCILEMGFNQRATRTRFAGLAREAGLAVQLHLLNVPAEERWRRVEERNASGGGHLTFALTRPMFDFVEQMWEPPDEAEMTALNGVRVD